MSVPVANRLHLPNIAPVRAWAAPLVAAVALGGAVEGIVTPAEAHATPNAHHLIPMKDTYGYNIKVWESDRKALEQATVVVLSKPTSRAKGYNAVCTGTKMNIDGETVISTAAHCFEDITGQDNGLLNPKDFLKAKIGAKAINITGMPVVGPKSKSKSEAAPQPQPFSFRDALGPLVIDKGKVDYAIVDPPKHHNYKTGPLSKVDQIGLSTQNADQAFMNLTPKTPGTKPSPARAAKPVEVWSTGSMPYVGEEVALYNSPGFNQNVPIRSTGRFIRRVNYVNNGEKLDLVAVKKRGDCMYGASGSSATASYDQHGNTYVSGALDRRYDIKFNPALITDLSEEPYQQQYDEMAKDTRSHKNYYERISGISLDGFSTICAYAAPRSKIIKPILKAIRKQNPIQTSINR